MAFARSFTTLTILLVLLLCNKVTLCAQESERDDINKKLQTLRASKDFSPKNTVYIDLLNEQAWNYRYYQADSLLQFATKALNHSTDASYIKGESTALLRLGDYYSDKGDNVKAIEKYTSGLALAQEIKDQKLVLRTMNNLAGEYAYKGDYAKALTGYLDGIELAEEVEDLKMLSILNENIASLYASQKDYAHALDFYKKVKKLNDKIGDDVNSAETMSNLSSLYADMGRLEYAMFNINKSIAIFEKERVMDWLAYSYEIKGKAYLKQQKYKWALYWYHQSDLLHQNLDDDRSRIDLLNGMAEAFLGQGKDSISQKHALEAFEISNRIQFLEGTQKCAKTLYKVNKNKGDFETALVYHELYQKMSDTLSRNENKKSLAMLKTKNEYEKQKHELIEENEKALAGAKALY